MRQNYFTEPFIKKTNGFEQFQSIFFEIPQQLTIHKCLTEILWKTYDLTKRPIKRFVDTDLFKHVMFEMCKEAYGLDLNRDQMNELKRKVPHIRNALVFANDYNDENNNEVS